MLERGGLARPKGSPNLPQQRLELRASRTRPSRRRIWTGACKRSWIQTAYCSMSSDMPGFWSSSIGSARRRHGDATNCDSKAVADMLTCCYVAAYRTHEVPRDNDYVPANLPLARLRGNQQGYKAQNIDERVRVDINATLGIWHRLATQAGSTRSQESVRIQQTRVQSQRSVRAISRILHIERITSGDNFHAYDQSMQHSSAALAGSRTTDLVRFQLLGIKIPVNAAPLLAQVYLGFLAAFPLSFQMLMRGATTSAQMLENCSQLEEFVLNNTNLGDEGLAGPSDNGHQTCSCQRVLLNASCLAGIAVALGRCGRLYHISLSGCRLTDHSRTHIAKVISVRRA